MAYRRRQGITRGATFKEEIYHQMNKNGGEHDHDDDHDDYNHNKKNINKSFSFGGGGVDHHNNNGSLAARAIRASAAHRDSSAYGYAYAAADPSSSPPSSSSSPYSDQFRSHSLSKGSYLSESNSVKDPNDPKYGFWGILARKAKLILDEDDESSDQTKSYLYDREVGTQFYHPRQASESGARVDNARFRKGLDKITSSLNHIGDTLGNAFEEGRTMVEHKTADIIQETRNKTADIIQETRRIQIRRRGGGNSDTQDQTTVLQNTSWQRPVIQPVQTHALANQETQLKASRDVAMATAAKAKVLLRELKTVKADLAFAKERCAQLEEENKRLRENRDKGSNPADDDLIRLQLETLLAEKARLAHENSIYARENRFLREIVEYHQLTMQDVVYLDEGAEEVTEVYPYSIDDAKLLSTTPTSPISPSFFPEVSALSVPSEMNEHVSEESEEICKPTTSLPSKPSPLQVCTNSSSTEKSESVKVPMSSETVADENTEATQNTRPTISIAEDTKRY